MMRKLLVVLGLVTAVGLAAPAPAAAHFSLSIGLPGFGLFVHDPPPPPVVAYVPGPRVVYRPVPVAPVYYYYGGHRRGHGHGHPRWRHHRHGWR